MATSSASCPDIVAAMLDAGRVEAGMRVLEIGTGTGYTAALLAQRLGARNVTTIEIDSDLAARARAALDSAGYGDVTVITGDGSRGYPDRAPYDRVLSTAQCSRTCPQPQTGLLSLVSGARETTPGTGRTADRHSSPTS
jgi:protein-L-isoaspartate(D-aspartate) O-methyltransferase